MALPNVQTQTNIEEIVERVGQALLRQNTAERRPFSESRVNAIKAQVRRALTTPDDSIPGLMSSLGINIQDKEELREIEGGLSQVKKGILDAQAKEAEEKARKEEEKAKETEKKSGGGGGNDEEIKPIARKVQKNNQSTKKQPAREQQQTTATAAQAPQVEAPPKPEETNLPKQLADINKQIETIDGNMQLSGFRSNREMREQTIRQRELLSKEKQIIEQNLGYLRELNDYNSVKEQFGSYPEAVRKLTSNQAIVEEIRAAKGQNAQITPQEIQQKKAEKLTTLQNQARYLEQTEQRLGKMANQVGPDLQKYKPQTVKPTSNSGLIERDLIQGGFDYANDLSSQEIQKIARERSNPYDVIGIDRTRTSPQNLKAAYSTTLARLAKSSDPNAPAAIRNLQSTYGLLDSVSNGMTSEEVRKMGDQVQLQRAQLRATAARTELKQQRDMWNQKVPATGNENLNLRDWYKNKKSDYAKRKVETYRNVYWGVGKNVILKPGKFIGNNIAVPAGRATKRVASAAGRSIATSRPVQWVGQTKIGGFAFRLPGRLKNAIVSADHRIGDAIGSRFAKKYVPHRKKSKSRALTAVSMGAKLYVDKIFRTLNNVKKAAQNFAYTYSGLKRANRTIKAISNSLTNTKTRLMGGMVGKGLIGAQRALNGVRALGRATGAGLRYGAVGAGVALAMGAGAPTMLTIAALTGAAGSALKLTTDTLNATKLGPGMIGRFQEAHGVLGKEVRLQQELLSPARALRTRAYTMIRSLNTGFYGFAGGAVLASLLGASPLLAAAAGVAVGGTALTARYAAGRAAVNAATVIGSNSTLMALGKLPFMELVGLASAAPWINSQIAGFRAGGLDFIKDNYFNPLTVKNWINYLKGAELGFNIGGTVGAFRAMTAIRGVSLGAVGLGAGVGTIGGMALASLVGGPLGTFAIAGGMIGGIAGGFIGTALGVGTGFWGTAIFATIGSSIFSFLGAGIGSLIDKVLGKVDFLKYLMSALSLAKTLMDFVNTLGKKFDPTAAFGLAFALVMMGTVLVDLGFDNLPSNQPNKSKQTATQTSDDANRIKGESLEVVTLDCLEDVDHKVYNPNTSIVTKILRIGENYEIQTSTTIFKNITKPTRIEKYSTLSKGEFVGSCQQ